MALWPILLLWAILAGFVGLTAAGLGRSGAVAAVLALVLSPVLVWLIYLALGPTRQSAASPDWWEREWCRLGL